MRNCEEKKYFSRGRTEFSEPVAVLAIFAVNGREGARMGEGRWWGGGGGEERRKGSGWWNISSRLRMSENVLLTDMHVIELLHAGASSRDFSNLLRRDVTNRPN